MNEYSEVETANEQAKEVEHRKTLPWLDNEFIRLKTKVGVFNLSYEAKNGKIHRVHLPGGDKLSMSECLLRFGREIKLPTLLRGEQFL